MREIRSVRCLTGLRDASSARVLNLIAVEKAYRSFDEYRKAPMFESPVLNSCILLKHRLRSDEYFLFDRARANVTKILIPFDKGDLRLGGVSLLWGQRGDVQTMREAGKYNERSFERDKSVLDMLNELPSLDPFLIHERLQSGNIHVSDCYFELSKADKQRMHQFVTDEISQLITLALQDRTPGARTETGPTAKMVSALLSTSAEEQLEPLRLTLMLGTHEFRQGLFSWRGFLYYKWSSGDLLPKLAVVAQEITKLVVTRSSGTDERKYIAESKQRLINRMSEYISDIAATLAVYDKFYADLVEHGQPQVFRDFLLRAPKLFLELGEKQGGLAHIASFWRYRFPKPVSMPVDAETAVSLLTDFMASVGVGTDGL
jgi:hypothetical protein